MTVVPKGYRFAAVAASFKKPGKLDLGLAVSEVPAMAAGVYTTNLFQAAPVLECKRLAPGPVRAVLVNSGQANACTGEEGVLNCREVCGLTAGVAGLPEGSVLPASTGVIGMQLKMDRWREAMPDLKAALVGPSDPEAFARAMMTTDTFPKIASAEAKLAGGTVRLVGMAKGSGMICPNMATLLTFVFCDAEADAEWWQGAVRRAAGLSFNRITVDGDTSTNDTLLALANGASGVEARTRADRGALENALYDVCRELAYLIVRDAEGGTKVARIRVTGALTNTEAEVVARAVGHSPLVKTALFGGDANWGRVVAAVGRSGAQFEPENLVLRFGDVVAFEHGTPAGTDAQELEELLAPLFADKDVLIQVDLGAGEGEYELLTSDLSRDYVSINADYRT
ncbi:MAG: bifunctional glutamate N-acetyltransferase/amino-acid acetyltransferase ArgJ [Desulfovibrionaceae bacterium]